MPLKKIDCDKDYVGNPQPPPPIISILLNLQI